MKEFFKRVKDSDLIVMMILLLCAMFGIAGMETVSAVAPIYGDQILDGNGVAIEGEINLTEASEKAPELISKHFVKEVIRMDPYSYPAMSIMAANHRWQKKEKTNDHIIQVNRITTPPVQVKVNSAITDSTAPQIPVDFGMGNSIVGLHQTIFFMGIKGYDESGENEDEYTLQARVVARDGATTYPILKPLNGKKVGDTFVFPDIPVGTIALRGDRVGTETQLRTDQFGILPSPTDYYVTKRLIEFGTTGWFDNATKNIRWGDQEIKQTAMTEFLRTSAPSFWLGKQSKQIFAEYSSGVQEQAFYPEGMMHQASRLMNLEGEFKTKAFVNMQKIAFGDNNSGNLKYFFMGDEISPLVQEYILTTPGLNHNIYQNKALNINFSEVIYAGGKRVRFIDDPSLNDCGLNDKGFIMDPKYAGFWTYEHEFMAIDGKKMQSRDVKGMAVREESAYILTNPDANVVVEL